jgi:hypothetical protein
VPQPAQQPKLSKAMLMGPAMPLTVCVVPFLIARQPTRQLKKAKEGLACHAFGKSAKRKSYLSHTESVLLLKANMHAVTRRPAFNKCMRNSSDKVQVASGKHLKQQL